MTTVRQTVDPDSADRRAQEDDNTDQQEATDGINRTKDVSDQ